MPARRAALTLVMLVLAGSGCAITAKGRLRNQTESSKAAFKDCLRQNATAPARCEALRVLQDGDLALAGYYTLPHWPTGDTGDRCDEYGSRYYGPVISYKDDTDQLFVAPADACGSTVGLFNFPAADPSTHPQMTVANPYWGGKSVIPYFTADKGNGTTLGGFGYDSHSKKICWARNINYNVNGAESPDFGCFYEDGTTEGPWDVCANSRCTDDTQAIFFKPGTDIALTSTGLHSGNAGANWGPSAYEIDFSLNPPTVTPRMTHLAMLGGSPENGIPDCSITGPDNCPVANGGSGTSGCTGGAGPGFWTQGQRSRGAALIGNTFVGFASMGERCFYGWGAAFQKKYGFLPSITDKGYHHDHYHPVLFFYDASTFGALSPNNVHWYAYQDITAPLGGVSSEGSKSPRFTDMVSLGTVTADTVHRRLFVPQNVYPNGMRIWVFTY